ncbi:MAG: hypothetical protein J2P21_11295 [Chloracidobacterium sp.]|nr:hypothetical protein [Chloracidobacterium sp.]
MSETYTARQIVEAVKLHPFVFEQITLESTLSCPIPIKIEDRIFLAFFFYPAGGPINDFKIWPPYYRVLADTESIENIQFTRVEPKDFGINFPNSQPLGNLDDEYLNGVTESEYKAMVERFFGLVDDIVRLYLKPSSELSAPAKDVVKQFHRLFYILAPKTKLLLPYYRAMNPEFFDWIDEISAG